MTLSYIALWGVIVLSYPLGYCTGALLKQMSLADAATVALSIEPEEQAPDRVARHGYGDLRHALPEHNLTGWTEELERRRDAADQGRRE